MARLTRALLRLAAPMKIDYRKRRRNGINIIPLVDVLIVLIFFFLMTMQFSNLHTLNLKLPEIETAGRDRMDDKLSVAVDSKGSYFINQQSVTESELLAALTVAGSFEPKQSVLVMADERVPLKHVTFLIDQCRQRKLETIRLQAR